MKIKNILYVVGGIIIGVVVFAWYIMNQLAWGFWQ